MERNWWETAPLADTLSASATSTQGASWWEAAPLADADLNPTPALPMDAAAPSPLASIIARPIPSASVAPSLPVDPAPQINPFADIPTVETPQGVSQVQTGVSGPQTTDPLLIELQRALAASPEALRPQIEARIADVQSQLRAEAAPQEPVQPLSDLGKRFARGATSIPAGVVEGLAIAGAGNPNASALVASEIAQGAREQLRLADERLAENPDMSAEDRARIEAVREEAQKQIAAYQELADLAVEPLRTPTEDRPLFQAGDKIRQASQELFGTPDPQFDKRFLSKLSEGAGSLAGFAAATLATGVVGGAVTGAGVNASEMFRRARQAGANEEEAKAAAFLGSLVGATEVVPIGRALDLLPSALRARVADALGQRLANAFVTAGEEGAQEALADISNNLIERGIFNPERGVFEGAGEDALIGAILGGGLGAVAPTHRVVTTEPPETGGRNEPASVEPVAPVGSGFPRGGRRDQADPEIRGRDRAGRPESPDVDAGLPAVDGPGEQAANLTPPVLAPQTPVTQAPQGREDAPIDRPAEPTPAAEAPVARPDRRATVFTPDNEPVEVEYQVVEADQVITSDQDGFNQSAQPRNRSTNRNSEMQIESIANAPNFARLFRSPETDRGAPVVGPDGLVESGNGRVIGLRRAYERGTADEFRAALEAEFPEAAGMRQPIIIARRLSDVNREDFAIRSNRPATMALSAVEEARAEARLVDKDVLDLYRGGPITAAANRDMVRAFIRKLPTTEQNRMLNPEGGLSMDGMRRVQAAVFARAFDDPDLLTRMAESVDNDMRGLTNTLTDLAPQIARMRDAMERGAIAREGDFIPALTEAVRQVSNLRSRDMNLRDMREQIDAFAEPISPDAEIIMEAMFNPAGTRLASQKALRDFLEFAIEGAEAQDTTTETLPGVEPVPPKSTAEILTDARRKAQADQEQGALLDRADEPGPRPRQGRSQERRATDDRRRQEDGGSGAEGRVSDAAPARTLPGGKLSPTFLSFAYTNRGSVFDHAFRAAGVDPSTANLMPAEEQIRIIGKAIRKTFGIRVELPTISVRKKNLAGRKVTVERRSLEDRKVIDQMLNAYRQLQMLAHIMGMPEKAIGLPIDGQPLTLSLVKGNLLRGALGQFSWGNGKRTITIADMSNSFAHEWAHALDHYLAQMVDRPTLKGLLSRDMSGQGVIPPLSPKRALTDAFAHVMWSMMGRSSAAGEITLRLQVESAQLDSDGKPTPKAKRAQKILTDIREGRPPPPEYLNSYALSSQEFARQIGDNDYITDPAEMFARAFEAMTAHMVGQISDQPQAFLSKGDFSGTSDPRLNLTFPKDVDLQQFTLAMKNLQVAMARLNLHGPDAPARVPETHDPMGTAGLLRAVKDNRSLLKREADGILDSIEKIRDLGNGLRRAKNDTGEVGMLSYRHAISTGANIGYSIAYSYEGETREALLNVVRKVAKDPGRGDLTENIFEEEFRRAFNRYDNMLQRALDRVKQTRGKRISHKDWEEIRSHLNGIEVKNPDPALRKLASDMRGIYDDVWHQLQNAGIELAYTSQFEPRTYDANLATANAESINRFLAKAKQVYGIMFQREVVNNTDPDSQHKDIKAIVSGLRNATAALPDGDRAPSPRLSEDDELLVEAYLKARTKLRDLQRRQKRSDDPDKFEDKIAAQLEVFDSARAEMLEMLADRWSEFSAENWHASLGTGAITDYSSIGPTANFLKGRVLPDEAGEIMREFMNPDPISVQRGYLFRAMRMVKYAEAFGAKNEKLENMLRAAKDASAQDKATIKTLVNASTGRMPGGNEAWMRFASLAYAYGTIRFLPRAAFSSLHETVTLGLRTRSFMDAMRGLIAPMILAMRQGRRRELRELIETMGLVPSYSQDHLIQARLGGEFMQHSPTIERTVRNFFIYTGLTPLTHFQRSALLPVQTDILRRLLRDDRKRGHQPGKRVFSDRELNELGIARDVRGDLLDWLDSFKGVPSVDDLLGPDGNFHKAAELYNRAMYRFSIETVQEPLKSDKPIAANDPNRSVIYALQGFISGFTRNEIFRNLLRGTNRDDPLMRKLAQAIPNIVMIAPSALALYMGVIMGRVIREVVFNWQGLQDEWDKDEDATIRRILKDSIDQSGLYGRFDIIHSAYTYGTDSVTFFVGPYLSQIARTADSFRAVFDDKRNSPNTNTAEWNALKEAYRGMVQVGLSALIVNHMPIGAPLQAAASRLALFKATSNSAPDWFATALVGEKGTKHRGTPPWWEVGD